MVRLLGKSQSWKFRNQVQGYERNGALSGYWKVALDTISDEVNPKIVPANQLLEKWIREADKTYGDGLIPIQWFLECREHGVFEYMPFQFNHMEGRPPKDFLALFTWPENASTGQRLDWLTLPVADKQWNAKHADKGGFIQEATGWKPSILQPYLYLPALTATHEEF